MEPADNKIHGLIRFTEPDKSLPPEDRAYFAQSPTKVAKLVKVPLHDFRTSTDIARGVQGLDTQGFTYIDHVFSLEDDEIFQGRNAEDIYASECIDLVLKLTGAKRAVVHNIDIRQKPGSLQPDEDLTVPLRGSAIDQEIEKFPTHELFGGYL
jgi:GA4 desaturase